MTGFQTPEKLANKILCKFVQVDMLQLVIIIKQTIIIKQIALNQTHVYTFIFYLSYPYLANPISLFSENAEKNKALKIIHFQMNKYSAKWP